jgi:hypothetical protein
LNTNGIIARHEYRTLLTDQKHKKKDFYNLVKLEFRNDSCYLEKFSTQYGGLMGFDEKKLRQSPDFYERFVWMNIKNYSKGYP